MTDLGDDRRFWGIGEVLRLSWPASLTMLNGTIMQFVDGLMVSRLIGRQALSAQFVAGILSFVPISLAMGVCSVINTFISQNLGAGRPRMCARYTWNGLYLAAAFGALLVPLAACARGLFGGVSQVIVHSGGRPTAPAELAMQTVYFQYLVAGAAATIMARVVEQFFYGTHRPLVVYVSSLVALAVNVFLNYVLITGAWGFPALGLRGAALGTVIGWAVSFLLPLAIFLRASNHRRFRTRTTWRLWPRLLGNVLRIGWPAGVRFCNDIFAWSVFNSVLVGYFGGLHRAASAAAVRYMHISFMPAVGIGIACTAVMGRYIGQGRPDLARRRAHAAVIIAVIYTGLCALAFLFFRRPMIELFAKGSVSAAASAAQGQADYLEIVRIGAQVMLCAALFQCFDAIAIVYAGSLRGAGDTLWPMLVTMLLSWTLNVGGGVAAIVLLPQLGSVGPWLAASFYVIVLGLAMAWRFESGAWRKIDLLGRAAPVGGPPPPTPAPPGPQPGPALPLTAGEDGQ